MLILQETPHLFLTMQPVPCKSTRQIKKIEEDKYEQIKTDGTA